ncbi:hypothetical protein P8452_16980 [Trifolium repens]|nr:hypothetical protein P8452_16980 [Trifolium repens]
MYDMLYIKELLIIIFSLRLSLYGFADPVCMGLKVILGVKLKQGVLRCSGLCCIIWAIGAAEKVVQLRH